MKKLQRKLLIFFPIFLLLIVPLKWAEGQTAPAVAAETAQMKATVVKTSGDVRIRNRGSIFWHDAKVNEVLGTGDQIETKENGKIEVKLENNNVIDLKPKTKLILRKLTSNLKTGDYENLLESNIGKIRAKVEKIKGNSKFEIKTPTAIAAVRGTIVYLLVYPDSTMAFFEEGVGFVTNPFSGQAFDVEPGNVYQIDDNGNVTGPVIPTDEQLQDIIEGWNVDAGAEGYTEPEGGGGEDQVADEADEQTEEQEDSNQEAQDDKQNSQNTELTAFEGSGLLGGTTETDTDGDGIPDSVDTDDDGDGVPDNSDDFPLDKNEWVDTDKDGTGNNADLDDDDDDLSDTEELAMGTDSLDEDSDDDGLKDGIETKDWWVTSDPLDFDSDNDSKSDYDDAFPRRNGRRETRQRMRERIKEMLENNDLRNEIEDMLSNIEARSIDSVMERINDAQTGKVLRDRSGNRVRVEQYVLRPNSNTVEILNVNLRGGTGSLAGLHTLDWKTTFNQSLDNLTSGQLRDLSWNDYLESSIGEDGRITGGPNYGGTKPDYWPTVMTVEMKNPASDVFNEKREFSNLYSGSDWKQDITNDQIYVNGAWRGFIIRTDQESGAGNPRGFIYNPDGLGDNWNIRARFYVIGDGDVGRIAGMDTLRFDTIWDALGVNLSDYPNIGDNNLEIRLSSNKYSKNIDLIYIPWNRQHWQ